MAKAGKMTAGARARRALVFSRPGRVELVDEPLPEIAPGAVLVRTRASAISAGTELLAFRGELPSGLPLDETAAALAGQTFDFPFRYGYAQTGEIVEVGQAVDAGWLGKRIFAFAPHADAFVIPASDAIEIPDGIDWERAALLAHAETAVNLVLDGQPLLGENVLVMGVGTIGRLTAGLLARFPLARLVLVDRDRRRLVEALHALRAGPAATTTAVSAVAPTVEDITRALGPRGADLVVEVSGQPEALNLAFEVTAHEGRVVVGSWYGARRGDLALGGSFHRRRIKLLSSQVSHIAGGLVPRWDRRRRFEVAWAELGAVDARAMVSHRIPFAEAQSAYERLDRGGEGVRQILLVHDGEARPPREGGIRNPSRV